VDDEYACCDEKAAGYVLDANARMMLDVNDFMMVVM
jgi:hypothetical protein